MKPVKIIVALILIPSLLFGGIRDIVFKNTDTLVVPYKYDYKKCLFTIKSGEWINHNNIITLTIIATLNNTSDDTLKYKMMTFHALSYLIESKKLESENAHDDILKNIPEMHIIPPHQIIAFPIYLVKKQNITDYKGKLKMKFCLITPATTNPIEIGGLGFYYPINDHGEPIKSKYDTDIKKRTHWLSSNTVDL
jgi:hypothetical protein